MDYSLIKGLSEDELKRTLRHGLIRNYILKNRAIFPYKNKDSFIDFYVNALNIKDISYFNGNRFGQMCINADISLNKETIANYKIRKIVLDGICFDSSSIKVEDLPTKMANIAQTKIQKKYFNLENIDSTDIKRAIVESKIKNIHLNLRNKMICFSYTAKLIPAFLRKNINPSPSSLENRKLNALSKNKISAKIFELNLKGKKTGDFLPEYGEHLVVQVGPGGKAISTVYKHAYVYFPVNGMRNFTLKVFLFHNIKMDFGFLEKVLRPIDFYYKNYERDNLEIHLKKDNNGILKSTFVMGKNIFETNDYYVAANYNEYKFVKKGDNFRIFCNGKYIITFFTKGDKLNYIKVNLNRGDMLYKIVCNSL